MLHLYQQNILSKVDNDYSKLEELLTELYNGKRGETLKKMLHEENHTVMKGFINEIGNAVYKYAKSKK